MLIAPFDVETLMVPQSAVQADQQGNFVFTIGADNKVTRQNIEVGERVGSDVVVLAGLESGDTVVVQGVQKVRPGQMVKTRDVNDKGSVEKSAEE
jgi:hypothetical protein